MVRNILLVLILFCNNINAAPDFKTILETKTRSELDTYARTQEDFYIARHTTSIGRKLPIEERNIINDYTDAQDTFNFNGDFTIKADAVDLDYVLKNMPGISNLKVDEVYSGQKLNSAAFEEGDYIVANGRPMSFTESPEIAATFARSGMLNKGTAVIYTVENPTLCKPIAGISSIPREAEMLYNYGSSFKITSIENITLEAGENTGSTLYNVHLAEVDSVSDDKNIFRGSGIKITEEDINSSEIPKQLRVKLTKTCEGACGP